LDIDAIRRLYGSALAMRLTTERQLASNVGGRLPGLDAHPDSNVMLETLTGGDLDIDFGDFLNLKMNRTHDDAGGRTGNPVMAHSLMESKLGL
jgi:Proteasome maturation factor UMP1.